ncbi:MAG: tandem-95 repeat protein [Bacteroidales bacterium]|nr:tandem-95 repeat protein [Bacteroidales bacterium]MDY0196482.1 tandem-95 repeat protein [Tenuifilaceae bacterium]
MKRILFLSLLTCAIGLSFAQEGTKQFMPNSNDRLWLEFGAFAGNNFGLYDSKKNERINIYLEVGEKIHFGMKLASAIGTNFVVSDPRYVYFRIKDSIGTVVYPETRLSNIVNSNGYIADYTNAINGPNGAVLNGTTITGGYDALTYTAQIKGNHYIEFRGSYSAWQGFQYLTTKRFALQFFDVTVTDASNNVITNPGEPNKSAGRLWSKGWSFTTASFTEYPVNANFYVFTSDEFINKVNFKLYPYSFTFVANSYGVTALAEESHYIKRTQSLEDDQTIDGIQEYNVFLNDPDRIVWPNTKLAPPRVQVWAEEELFFDYKYNREPLYLPIDYSNVILEKNEPSCPFDDVTFFKIESNIDGYTAILIDVDQDGEFSSDGNDRVIYRDMKKGLNYILWDFKKDNSAEVANGNYSASATFLGRGPAHFPLYDVERLDGITTSSVRPFNKLQTTLYWDDTPITRWGDETGAGQMDATQRKQLVVGNNVPRIWSWNAALQNVGFNGNMNTMNTWFNAIDLGYGNIGIVVQESSSKCVDGSSPWVGDVYLEGPKNQPIAFKIENFDYKFFHPSELPLSTIRIVTLPTEGTLRYNGSPAFIGQEIARSNVGLISYVPTADYHGKTSFIWKGCDSYGQWSNNQENVYLIINTPPTISPIDDQNLCTNSTTNTINFTVSDAETPADLLEVIGFSGFPEFVPHKGIIISGTGENRTVTVNPVANKSGKAIIYIMVDDGLSQVIEEFAVTVSPSLEFTGDTIVCVGQDLYLVAEEFGANSYSWKYNGVEVSNQRTVQQSAGAVDIGDWTLTIQKTVEGNTCTSTRFFTVDVSPLTTFTGDLNVCVGEELLLTATEVNATSYIWRRGTTTISTQRKFSKASVALADAGNDYTLFVDKDGCQNTSLPFRITVKNLPNTGLTVQGSTVDPGKNGTITINNTENDVTYVVFKNGNFVTSSNGPGNISISIDALVLEVGSNEFTIQADNGNCSIEFPQPVYIMVNQPGIKVSPLNLTTYEGGSSATFTVVLETEPNQSVTIPISSSNTDEGTVSPNSLTFTPINWASTQTVTVSPVRDWIIDGNKTYSIILALATDTDPFYSVIDADDVTVTNIDIDVAGVTVTGTNLETTEAGGSDQFTLVLTAKPSANVTINFSGVNTSEGSLSDNSIIFTPANWDSPQTVIVTGVNDDIDDGDAYYTINMASISGDSNFSGLSIASVNVINSDDDTVGLIVSKSSIATSEAGGSETFTVVLATQPTAATTISITSSNNNEGKVNSATLVFTASNWSTLQSITVTGQDDDVVDGDVTYTVTVQGSAGDANYVGLSHIVNAVNLDNDVAEIWTSKTTLNTSEPNITDSFMARLTAKPSANITIAVISSKTAEATVSPATLAFTPANWDVNQQVTVTGVNDDVIDGGQNYTVTLSVSGSAGVFTGVTKTLTGVNADDDVAGIQLAKSSITTTEAGGSDSFGVRLTAKPTSSVNLSISGLDISEGSISATNLTFTTVNWDVYQNVVVTGINDDEQDGNQTYTLSIAYVSGDTGFATVTAAVQVTNIDDDNAGITVSPTNMIIIEGNSSAFSISLSSKPTSNVTINITSPNVNELSVSPASVTFTPLDWASKQITVNAINENVDDGDQLYTITTSNAVSTDGNYTGMTVDDVTVNITDIHTAGITVSATSGNTTEAGGTATFSVVLNAKPTANVTITSTSLKLTEGTISANATITFTPSNWGIPQFVTVKGVDDKVDDGDQPYQVSVQISSADPKYDSSLNTTVDFINEDNDTAGATVSPTSGLVTTEGGGTATSTIVLNTQPTHGVTINLVSSNIAEGTVSPASLTFTTSNWNTPRTITLIGVNDNVADGDQPYTISSTATSSDAKYNNISIPTVSATNIDDDVTGVIVSAISGNTTEAGGTATFTVILNSEPQSPVSITSTSNDTSEGVVSDNKTIIFNSTNWGIAQTVTVRGINDNVADGNQAYTIGLSASSSDNGYNSIAIANVNVINEDDDIVGLTISTSSIVTSEPDVSTTFTVRLQSQPIANVTLGITSSDETEGKVSPTSLSFTTANWSTPKTVTVTGQDDDMVDGSVPYQVILSSSTSADGQYAALSNVIVSAVNNDNDVAGIIVSPYAGLSTTEAGGTAQFTIVLRSRPKANISIRMSSSNVAEGIISGVSRGSVNTVVNEAFVTFTPEQWNSPVTVTVTGVDDSYDDGDKSYDIITEIPQTTDNDYNTINPRDVSLTNIDNDTFGVVVSPSSLTVNEDGASKSFTIVLNSRPTHDVTIPIHSSNASRLSVSASSIIFTTASSTDWQTPKEVNVIPVNNQIDEGNEEIMIVTDRIVSGDSNYGNYNPADVTVQFIEDDNAGVIVSPISGNTTEEGGQATFTIALSSQPTANVVIGISSSNETEGKVSTPSVTFTAANWNIPIEVIVTGQDDAVIDGNQIYYIVFANAVSTDLSYNDMVIPSIEAINEDDDSAGVSVFPISGLITSEAGQTATFTVKLNTIPTGDVAINVASSNVNEGSVSPSTLTFTAGNWGVTKTVTVTGVDDLVADGDQTYEITLTIDKPSTTDLDYKDVIIQSVSVTNKDDLTPRPQNDTGITDQENAVTISVLNNDLGLDYAPAIVSIASQAVQGTAIVNPDNSITYIPNRNYHGDFTFTYSVCNSLGNCAQAQVTVTVTRVNAVPIAHADFRGTSISTPVEVDVLFNDENLYDIPITVSLIGIASPSGTLEVTPANAVIFTPSTNYVGVATFTYRATDFDGDFDEALVTINVREENHKPIANDDNVTVIQNTPKAISVLSNDSGLEDGFGSMSIYSQPSNGIVSINVNHTITYSPNTNFIGADSFEYFIEDIDGDFDIATVYVEVIERPNAIPVAVPDSRATEMNTPITVDVLFNDYGLEDGVDNVYIASSPANGTVQINPDFTVTYTPNSGYLGTETFSYQVCDVDNDCSNTALVTILVKPIGSNHIPVAVDDNANTFVNTAVTIDVLSNDYGFEDGFGGLIIHTKPEFGEVVVNSSNTITYSPSYMFTGTITFEYVVSDIEGDYDMATVTVTVLEKPNSIPVANDVSLATGLNTPRIIDVLYNDTGLEDVPIVVTIRQQPSVEQGTVAVNGDNSVTFTPAADYIGIYTFEYTVTDADGDSDWATVTVAVKDGENFAPMANDDVATTQINTPIEIDVLANDTGLGDGFGSLSIYQNPDLGSVEVTDRQTIIYTPNNFFIGEVTFRYLVSDVDGDFDIATVTVTVVEKPNSIPVANDVSLATGLDTPRIIDVLYNDSGLEDVPIVVTIRQQPSVEQGTAAVNGDNTVTFTPGTNYIGIAIFEYTVTDADGDSDWATVTVTVKDGENFIPNANDDRAITLVNIPVEIDALANDTGLDDGFGSLIIHQNPAFGSVEVTGNQTIIYTPSNFFTGEITFSYLVSDVDGDFDIATVSVGVFDEINPKPIANDDWATTGFNTEVTIDVLANDTGLEDEPIVVTILSAPDVAEGSAVVNSNNTVNFTPATNFIGVATFTYLVTDANGDQDDAMVEVTVKAGENFVPIANDDSRGTSFNTPIVVDVLENDLNLNDEPITVTISVECNPAFGMAVANTDNTVTFTPAIDYIGFASFIYKVTDADGDYDTALVSITVKDGENVVPVALEDVAYTHTDIPVEIDVLANDSGLDDSPIIVYASQTDVVNGSAEVLENNQVRFTPAAGFVGEATFKYRVFDFDGDFDEALVTVYVNSKLIAVNDKAEVMRNESVIVDVLANDKGIESIIPELTIMYAPLHGMAAINTDNTVTYTPDLNYFGEDAFEYKVCSQYGYCSEAKVNIDVKIEKFRIPEGFSPDGDGINDKFEIIGIEVYNKVTISVYNRWGNVVYQNNNYKNNWDGKANASMSIGSTLPNGTYYYIIEIVDTKEKFTGNVFLKR